MARILGCIQSRAPCPLFLGGSADEKMFRVVRDRERWFQIVMGQKFEFDEASSEELSNRVIYPQELAEELVFDLEEMIDNELLDYPRLDFLDQ
jgi:hypothetical protein